MTEILTNTAIGVSIFTAVAAYEYIAHFLKSLKP